MVVKSDRTPDKGLKAPRRHVSWPPLEPPNLRRFQCGIRTRSKWGPKEAAENSLNPEHCVREPIQKEKCRSVKNQANAIMGMCKWGV